MVGRDTLISPAALPWAIGIGLLALVVVILKNRTAPRSVAKRRPDARPGHRSGLLLGIGVAAALIAASVFAQDLAMPPWLIPAIVSAVGLLAILIAFRKVIWVYLRGLAGRQLPGVIMRDASGQATTRCPKCKDVVTVTMGKPGEAALGCSLCGESAIWVSELKPSMEPPAWRTTQRTQRTHAFGSWLPRIAPRHVWLC